ncbi:GTPase ObgE [Desulfoferula mesophila]|uniref:GTPase Obg n=1 Tax=Desulfoferula mesophila TaxID=3058419 RepID=A0AAU9F231_9BACT|nr:GTPase Obg [Desulfoferula mesophilus]
MRFVDEAIIEVAAGDGGHGCVSFLRERFRPKGGPDGGDGGRGGSVIIQATNRVTTLADHSYLRHFRAKRGGHGQGANKAGRAGEDKLVRVPVGTEVYDHETGELLYDLTSDGQEVVVAQGGRGGKGNAHFATSTNQAPRMAQPGGEGQQFTLRLELKLLAEVGLVGLPNAGKSSLITAASAARPKVADYPFTTLTPNLGVVQLEGRRPFTMADVPGLVAGAHQGAGLGLTFLKHVERTSLFLYVVDLGAEDPVADLWTVREELLAYDPQLASRAAMVAANKMDLSQAQENLAGFRRMVEELGLEVWPISAMSGQGVPELLSALADKLQASRGEDQGEQG